MVDLEKLKAEIEKTGFVHEHNVTSALEQHNWHVINGKYYVDDVTGLAREIDIVAYKTRKIDNVRYYTTLIVSCKMSRTLAWCLISRDKNEADPNMDWFPHKFWTNEPRVEYMLESNSADWVKSYHSNSFIMRHIFCINSHIFAFREVLLGQGKQNREDQKDKIFDAVIGLLKAQSHELSALDQRKKDPCFYSFHLLIVADATLTNVHLGPKITAKEITDDRYIANYIVGGKDVSARVHFIRHDKLEGLLRHYDDLHDHNVRCFSNMRADFFEGIMDDQGRLNVLADQFRDQVDFWFFYTISKLGYQFERDHVYIYLRFDKQKDIVVIDISSDDEHLVGFGKEYVGDFLNRNTDLREYVAKALLTVYKYDGQFEFQISDFPF